MSSTLLTTLVNKIIINVRHYTFFVMIPLILLLGTSTVPHFSINSSPTRTSDANACLSPPSNIDNATLSDDDLKNMLCHLVAG